MDQRINTPAAPPAETPKATEDKVRKPAEASPRPAEELSDEELAKVAGGAAAL